MTKIKICGLNRERSLLTAIESEADFFGVVMARQSPRYIDLALAKHLFSVGRGKIKGVVLLVEPTLDEAVAIARETQPFALQLHGNESPDLCMAIKKETGKKIIKAIAIDTAGDFDLTKNYMEIDYFLFDKKPASNDKRKGGLGKNFDWGLLKYYQGKTPFFLAGGLHADNVKNAIDKAKELSSFFAVDISSGVEQTLGQKSNIKIKKFCQVVKSL